MITISVKFALAIITTLLVFLTVFTYEVGISANMILPGSGDGMIQLAVASIVVAVLTTVYLFVLFKRK